MDLRTSCRPVPPRRRAPRLRTSAWHAGRVDWTSSLRTTSLSPTAGTCTGRWLSSSTQALRQLQSALRWSWTRWRGRPRAAALARHAAPGQHRWRPPKRAACAAQLAGAQVVLTTWTQPRHRVAPIRRREGALHALDRAAFWPGGQVRRHHRRVRAPLLSRRAGDVHEGRLPVFHVPRLVLAGGGVCQMKRDHLHQTNLSLAGLVDKPRLSVPAPAAAAPAEGDIIMLWAAGEGAEAAEAEALAPRSSAAGGVAPARRVRRSSAKVASVRRSNVRRPRHRQRHRERCGRARHVRAGSRRRSQGSAGGASVRGGELRRAAAPADFVGSFSGFSGA